MNLNELNSSLSAYWAFEETSGTRIDSVNNVPLIETDGIVSSAQGKLNTSALFDGQGYFYTPYFGNVKSFFISTWVFFEDSTLNTLNCTIIEKNPCFSIYTTSLGKWNAQINTTILAPSTFPAITTNTWYHITLGACNGIIYFGLRYITYTGTYPNQTATSNTYYTSSTYSTLDDNYDDLMLGNLLKGRIDETAIWQNPPISSVGQFTEIANEIFQFPRGIFYNKINQLWELKVKANDLSINTYPTLEIPPDNTQPEKLLNVFTYAYTDNVLVSGNDASNNRGTLATIDSTSLSLGTLSPGETSKTKIIKLLVPKSISIKNIKIGLIDTGGITFTNKTFGFDTRSYYDPYITPTLYFEGISDGTSASVNNFSIDNASNFSSYYVYLNVKLSSDSTFINGVVRFCWYFDYS